MFWAVAGQEAFCAGQWLIVLARLGGARDVGVSGSELVLTAPIFLLLVREQLGVYLRLDL